jgi:hypothetical protein
MVRNTNVGKLRVPGTSLHTQALGAVVVHRITLGGVLRLGRRFPASTLRASWMPRSPLHTAEVCRGQRVDGTAYTERVDAGGLTSLTPPSDRRCRAVCEVKAGTPRAQRMSSSCEDCASKRARSGNGGA